MEWDVEQQEQYVMLNMDLEKTYDRVGWQFITAVIEKTGLGRCFAKW